MTDAIPANGNVAQITDAQNLRIIRLANQIHAMIMDEEPASPDSGIVSLNAMIVVVSHWLSSNYNNDHELNEALSSLYVALGKTTHARMRQRLTAIMQQPAGSA